MYQRRKSHAAQNIYQLSMTINNKFILQTIITLQRSKIFYEKTLNMQVGGSSKTSILMYQNTWSHTAEDRHVKCFLNKYSPAFG